MQNLKKKMTEAGLGHVFWNLHLLKHKAMTDSENKHIAGHKDQKMRNRYDHSRPTAKPVKKTARANKCVK